MTEPRPGYNLDFRQAPDGLEHTATRDNIDLLYRAQNLRLAGGHISATCTIGNNGTMLQWGTIKIDKTEDRTRLYNAAIRVLPTKLPPPTEEALRHIFDLFCHRVWPAWTSRYDAEDMVAEASPGPLPMLIPGHIVEARAAVKHECFAGVRDAATRRPDDHVVEAVSVHVAG